MEQDTLDRLYCESDKACKISEWQEFFFVSMLLFFVVAALFIIGMLGMLIWKEALARRIVGGILAFVATATALTLLF